MSLAREGKQAVNAGVLAVPLLLALAAPGALIPRGHNYAEAIVRVRIISGVRVDFSNRLGPPEGAVVRRGLVEFE